MNAAVAAQTHQMQLMSRRAWFMAASRTGFAKNSPLAIIRSMRVTSMWINAPRADVEVPHFAVAHLAFGQSDIRAGSMHQRIREIAQQHVVIRLARGRDGVAFEWPAE